MNSILGWEIKLHLIHFVKPDMMPMVLRDAVTEPAPTPAEESKSSSRKTK
jgi:hypothetical protein